MLCCRMSQVFVDKQLIANDVLLKLYPDHKALVLDDGRGSERTYNLTDIRSLEVCFHSLGPSWNLIFEVIIVLRFSSPQSFLHLELSPDQDVILVVNDSLRSFDQVQVLTIIFERGLSADVVRLLPLTSMPSCVLELFPLHGYCITRTIKERLLKEKQEKQRPKEAKQIDDCIAISSDDDDTPRPQPTYYDIDGERVQITPEGIASLADGVYLNDEVLNLALGRIRKKNPHVHIFDTYNTAKIFDIFEKKTFEANAKMPEDEYMKHFGQYFYNKSEPRTETFLDKKMLIFPINHISHWLIVVVVNPCLADVLLNETTPHPASHLPVVYYIDSLKGTPKYPITLLNIRLEISWRCIFSFLRLGAEFHLRLYLNPQRVKVVAKNNIPSQRNSFDCGPHAIINTELVTQMYEELLECPMDIQLSAEKVEEVRNRVDTYRCYFKNHLQTRRI